ncbi:MAG TPA: hypothetical protein VJV03_12470 [Pyrinomonadaceae bacterium]|nr:hypothetical protein [Pyrinomonadaceae bacterium]
MYLVADRNEQWERQSSNKRLELAMLKWRYRSTSVLLHHGKACCDIARAWTFATDYMQLNGEYELTAPRWLRARYKWGPSKWPLSWCEAVEKKTLDCGALSAMSYAIFNARGITAYPAQLIQNYTEQAGQHWSANWDAEDAPADWVNNGLAYHEACAVVIEENVVKIWDPAAACWLAAPQFCGYSSVLAVRVIAGQSAMTLSWDGREIQCNKWQKIELPSDYGVAPEMINEAMALEQLTVVDSYQYESAAGGD